MKKVVTLMGVLVAVAYLAVGDAPEARSETTKPVTRIRDIVGVDGEVNDVPADVAQVAGWLRDYHKWYWYESTQGVYTWPNPWQYLDRFYGILHTLGVKVMPDVEFAPWWASSTGYIDGVPDATAHARYMGALVSHFGSTIDAVENYNEPNQWWQSVPFPATLFGVMTAGDYAAVKAANPQTLFVLAGMSGPDTAYWTTTNQWSNAQFDVLNFHWFASGDTTNGAKNPESGGLVSQIDRAKAWRDQYAPWKPIWITEFGWDTGVATGDYAGRISDMYAPEASAANYIVRAFLIMQAHGIEKGFLFDYRNVNPNDNTAFWWVRYVTSGLVEANNPPINGVVDGRKKVGWYYLATLRHVLGDYAFDRIVSDGPNVYHYEYYLPETNQRAAVLWASSGARDAGYQIAYSGPAGTLVIPTDGSTTGTVSNTDGNLVLGERPVFVLYTNAGTLTPTPTSTGTPMQKPDLVVAELAAPVTVVPGQSISLTWTVRNQAGGEGSPSWQDRVYLSTDAVWDGGDSLLSIVTQTMTLAAGSSYSVTRNAAFPKTPGIYYLILRTDMWNQMAEMDETNNQKVVPIGVVLPDLTPTRFSGAAAGRPGQTVPITWTVANQGNGAAEPTWEDRVYLSTDSTWDSGDAPVTIVTRNARVPAGGSYTTSGSVILPKPTGTYYLIFRTDMWGQETEWDETNNQQVVPIAVALPDLTLTAFTIPAAGKPWQTVPVTWTVTNQGPVDALPSWEDRVYLSTDNVWSSGDIFLTKVTHGATVSAGDSYTVSANVTLTGTLGSYYLIQRTDMWSQVAEAEEMNNQQAIPITVTLPDLMPTSFTIPSTAKPGQTVPVSWTVRNQGPVEALPSWEDRLYLSTDGAWDSSDTFLTKVTHNATVAAGGSYPLTANVTLPRTVGVHYLVFRTDMWSQLAESNEGNNQQIVPITVGLPDLTPIGFSSAGPAVSGQTIGVTWTVKNQGIEDASPSWQDRIYLSTDSTWDSGDTLLTMVTQTASLSAGNNYTLTRDVILPRVATGYYYLILRTDMWNQVVEADDANNSAAVAISVSP